MGMCSFEQLLTALLFKYQHIVQRCVSGNVGTCDAGESCALSSGVREEAMGWTMTVRDDLGVIAWTRRAGNRLSLFLLLSLFSLSVQSDVAFPREDRFSWKAGKMPSSFIYLFFFFSAHFPFFLTMRFICGEQ